MKDYKIIIADEHEFFRIGLEDILKASYGITNIYQAANGNEVIELLKRIKVDLIFMDVHLPDLDGILTTIETRKTDNMVKIIAVSYANDPYSIIKMMDAGANAYISKTTDKYEIADIVEQVFKESYKGTQEIRNIINEIKENHKDDLSGREIEIIVMVCSGFSTNEIADKLELSTRTIDAHRYHIMAKTNSKNLAGLILYAIVSGLYKIKT